MSDYIGTRCAIDIATGPRSITIGDMVRIHLHTKTIEYLNGYEPDRAAKMFWAAMLGNAPDK